MVWRLPCCRSTMCELPQHLHIRRVITHPPPAPAFSCLASTTWPLPPARLTCAAAYLANMAVDAKLRRQGHARLMLAAAEALVAARGFSSIWLHARLADAAAQQLYLSSGYAVMEQDNALLTKLRGITPRALMRKQLQ